VRVVDGRCRVRVSDSGVGLVRAGDGLGTGLSALRERLQLAFGADAKLQLTVGQPRGAVAEVDFPAQRKAA
ncbi:MAG: sensor histidine kinase, partial [Burkholderiaceae bacterium]